jgi:ABC-type transport system involved in cytochrome bd biosynthesis fused ATPase/permease subunit
LSARPKGHAVDNELAACVRDALLPGLEPLNFDLQHGVVRRLDGPEGCGKSKLLLMLAGFEASPPAKRFTVQGIAPAACRTGQVLYLGRQTPQLKGSLRREATLGIGRSPNDTEIARAIETAGLSDMADRLGGLDGKIAEGRRNLTASEQMRLHVARGLLARPKLALIDADEIGLTGDALSKLLNHLQAIGAAGFVVTSGATVTARLDPPIKMQRRSRETMTTENGGRRHDLDCHVLSR